MNGRCACGHSPAVHLQQRRRCLVHSCPCVIPRFGKVQVVEPGPQRRVTTDADGLVLTFEKPQPTPAQRILRESHTRKLERRLWRALELAGLPLPDALEYPWARAEGRLFRSDGFYRPNLLIEVDGGIWMRGGGGHSHPMHLEAQHERDNLAVLLGFRCLRFTEKMIADGTAVATIRRALQPAERLL